MIYGLVFFGVCTTCMIVGMSILALMDKPFDSSSYVVGMFSGMTGATIAMLTR